MAIVRPEQLEAFLAITAKWEVETSVLGEVTDTGRLRVSWQGELIVDVDPRTVAIDGPVYERPYARPEWQDALLADSAANLPRPAGGDELREQALRLLGSPNLADPRWITEQYDRYVLGNTAFAAPEDAGVVRIDDSTSRGFAVSLDCNARYAQLDPSEGSRLALAEAYRNVAATGAVPAAVSDCLNFGSPENPDVMWQFQQAVEGLADACLELQIPVTGGNVSFYNQTGDTPIHPTPVVAVLGLIDDVAGRVPSGWQDEGQNLYLLGETALELDGSAWADVIHGHLGGRPPKLDLARERELADLVVGAAKQGLLSAAHDLSEGGLFAALAEGVTRFGIGARVVLTELRERAGIDAATALFSESAGRMLVAVPHEDDVRFQAMCEARGFPMLRVGVTVGTGEDASLEVQGEFEVSAAELQAARGATLPSRFGALVGKGADAE